MCSHVWQTEMIPVDNPCLGEQDLGHTVECTDACITATLNISTTVNSKDKLP